MSGCVCVTFSLVSVWVFWYLIGVWRYESSMCLWAIELSRVAGYLFISLFLENDLCFKLNSSVSEEGALHNSQIWPEAARAAKVSDLSPQITLMWNNLVFCLWCFPLFSLCCAHPLDHPSSPAMTSSCIYLFTCIVLIQLCFVFSFVHSPCISRFTTCISCLYSPAVFWIPKCSACSLEGEWWLTSRFVHNYPNLNCCVVVHPHAEAHVAGILQACRVSGMQPPLKDCAPCSVTCHWEKFNIQDAWCLYNICPQRSVISLIFFYCDMRERTVNDHIYPTSLHIMLWLCSHLRHAEHINGARPGGAGVCAARHVGYL